ncbi:MAG: hypothetical protein ACK5MT_17125 [Actinomycetales bacterium]
MTTRQSRPPSTRETSTRQPRTRLAGLACPAGKPPTPAPDRSAGPGAALATAGVAAGASALAWVGRGCLPGGDRWERTNHRGRSLTLREGPSWASGAILAVATSAGLTPRQRLACTVATAAAAGLGALDDLAESGSSKGLRGHLGALARGQLTTGGLKVIGIPVASVLAAAVLEPRRDTSRAAYAARTVLAGGIVAGSANLLNLLDLRPGRALKAALLTAPVALTGPAPACVQGAVAGPSLALLPVDLGERGMLGDCGANAAGALVGMSVLLATAEAGRPQVWRSAVFAGLLGLTLASEKVSFTAVIEATPGLRELDALGRRPSTG